MNSESGFFFSSPFKIMYTSIKSPLILRISNVVRFFKVQYNNEIGLIEALLSHHENTGEPKK